MGCDIHLFSEVKINGVWHCHSIPNIERWYGLFEKMAGVRGVVEKAVSPPRGLPSDISAVVQAYFDYWNLDAHSISWLGSKEIEEVENWLVEHSKEDGYYYPEKDWGYLLGSSYSNFYKHPEQFAPFEDVRFVFWFDN